MAPAQGAQAVATSPKKPTFVGTHVTCTGDQALMIRKRFQSRKKIHGRNELGVALLQKSDLPRTTHL